MKIYCYIDESGQDTKGAFFVVSVVIADQELDLWRETCENIERLSDGGWLVCVSFSNTPCLPEG
ncbi:MAG: hypothetical protein ACE5GO_12325 [Anaerolineales bacterium]